MIYSGFGIVSADVDSIGVIILFIAHPRACVIDRNIQQNTEVTALFELETLLAALELHQNRPVSRGCIVAK